MGHDPFGCSVPNADPEHLGDSETDAEEFLPEKKRAKKVAAKSKGGSGKKGKQPAKKAGAKRPVVYTAKRALGKRCLPDRFGPSTSHAHNPSESDRDSEDYPETDGPTEPRPLLPPAELDDMIDKVFERMPLVATDPDITEEQAQELEQYKKDRAFAYRTPKQLRETMDAFINAVKANFMPRIAL